MKTNNNNNNNNDDDDDGAMQIYPSLRIYPENKDALSANVNPSIQEPLTFKEPLMHNRFIIVRKWVL